MRTSLLLLLAVTAVQAEPTREARTIATRAHGRFDAIMLADDGNALVLRRGDSLYTLSLTGGADARLIARAPQFAKARFVRAAAVADRHWVFMNDAGGAPFAFDLSTRRSARFEVPEAGGAPQIQGCSIVRHAGGAIVMVEGGGRAANWPRDGNRPVYFWMSLQSGRVWRVPVGWDLDFFSADRTVAVFEKPQVERWKRRPRQALDLATGALVDRTPDWHAEGCIHFSWPDAPRVHPVYTKREQTSDQLHPHGLSWNGRVYRFTGTFEGDYFGRTDARDGFAAFRPQVSGRSGSPGALWLMPLRAPERARVVARDVGWFALLDGGNCVYVSGDKAIYRNGESGARVDLLGGEQRLPPLDAKIASIAGVVDRMRVEPAVGVGSGTALALFRFTHYRGYVCATPIGEKPPLEEKTWRRTILVTSDGRRFRSDLFTSDPRAKRVWLHNSGRVLAETDEGGLFEYVLQLP